MFASTNIIWYKKYINLRQTQSKENAIVYFIKYMNAILPLFYISLKYSQFIY